MSSIIAPRADTHLMEGHFFFLKAAEGCNQESRAGRWHRRDQISPHGAPPAVLIVCYEMEIGGSQARAEKANSCYLQTLGHPIRNFPPAPKELAFKQLMT